MTSEEPGAEIPGAGRKVRSEGAEGATAAASCSAWRRRQNNGWESLCDCVSSSSNRCREGRRARRMASEEHAAKSPGAERKVMSAGGGRRRRRRRWCPRAQRELGSLRDCVSSSPTWCREGRRARGMALKVRGVESLGTGRKVRSAEAGKGRRRRRRQNNGWESFRDYVSINQVLRGTAGKENGVGKARGGEPGRGTESKECRGGEGAAVAAAAEQ